MLYKLPARRENVGKEAMSLTLDKLNIFVTKIKYFHKY
jgi:hypothetical protein